MQYKPVKFLNEQTAKKIAAGEVIERPASVVRELLDNAIDAQATKITVSLVDGGLSEIVVTDNGFGMSEQDLEICTETHTTSKISDIDDLFRIDSLGFRGEALSSIKAVSELEIISTQRGPLAHRFFNNTISKSTLASGTRVSVKNIFYNFPARKKFLKNAATEAKMCKTSFIEKALTHPHIEMILKNNERTILHLLKANNYMERAIKTLSLQGPFETQEAGFVEIYSHGETFRATIVLGLPEIAYSSRQYMYIFANGRRIDEYGLVQALDYGAAPFFPNGTHPVALAFIDARPESIDFNIHPAKREAKFSDYARIHHALSSSVSHFYKAHTISVLKKDFDTTNPYEQNLNGIPEQHDEYTTLVDDNFERRSMYERSIQHNFDKSLDKNRSYSQAPFESEYGKPYKATSFTVADIASRYTSHSPLDVPKSSIRFLGQVAGTFLAVEKNNTLYLIDQHAAHERILFEELKKHSGEKQELLVPYRIVAESEEEELFFEKNADALSVHGFEIEKIGHSIFSVNTVPILWKGTEAELSADIKKAIISGENILTEILALSACRLACKDGDILSPERAFDLVQKTFELEQPLCPHGRPLWVVITRDELFKRVKRT